MSKSVHIIQKQSYDIVVPAQEEILQLQFEIQDVNLLYILPAISNKLDELFREDEMVVIDKLELNIGTIQSKAGAEEWVEKIVKELETSIRTLVLLKSIEEIFEMQRINRSQLAILEWIYFLQTRALRCETVFKSVNELKEVIMRLDDISRMTLQNELTEHASSKFIQQLVLLEPDELFFFIKLFMPTIAKKDWTGFLEKITSLINTAKRKKKRIQSLNFSEIQNNVLTSVIKIIINSAKENKYACLDELILMVEENLIRFIAKEN